MKTVGEIIRQRREALGLTLQALAGEVEAAKSYLSMIENHRVANPPSRELLQKLERALGMDDGELCRAADWESTPAPVRAAVEDLADQARRGQDLAQALKEAAGKGRDGWRNLDKAFRGGQLTRLVNQALQGAAKDGTNLDPAVPLRYRVPVINRVAAGYPKDFSDLDYPARVADEYIAVPGLEDPDAFAARVVGESMLPEYREGDIVVFSPQARVENGSDCFVRLLPDHETTFKRVYEDAASASSASGDTTPDPLARAESKALGPDRAARLRLQPLNPTFAPKVVAREDVAGLYKAVWRFSKLG